MQTGHGDPIADGLIRSGSDAEVCLWRLVTCPRKDRRASRSTMLTSTARWAAVSLATTARGVLGGLVLAGVLVVVLTITSMMTWGWWPALAIVVVAGAGRLLSGTRSDQGTETYADALVA